MTDTRFSRMVARGFGPRPRPWRAALGGLVAAVVIAAAVGLVIGNRKSGDVLRTRGTPPSTPGNSAPPTSEPSTTAAPTTTGTLATGSTVGTQPPPVSAPTTPTTSSPWQVSATSGLTNLAPVTITATGIPPDSYYVGQCPAGEAPSFDRCVMYHGTIVTDGTLTSTLHAFWWLNGGQIDCGSAPGACVVGVMSGRTSAIVASFPISFDPARQPTITVTPEDSLKDRQTVVVHGVNIGEGRVQVGECLLPGQPACTLTKLVSRPDGTFTATITVSRLIDWFGRGGPVSSTCGIDGDCAMEVFVTPNDLDSLPIWINRDHPVGLHFVPGPPPTSMTTT